MIKMGYYYTGKNDSIKKLLDYDIDIIISNEDLAEQVLTYQKPVKIAKYCNECYNILVSDTDKIEGLLATKKFAIGKYETHKPKIKYLDKLDVKKLFEKPNRKDIKFSIIIPNYNNGIWINKTIESVLNQTYSNWEMYIIDDMSTDNSVDVIKGYNDRRITLITNNIKLYNGGSRNIGILKAKESNPDGYLLFIDSDDWLANDNVLENLNEFIEDEDLITLDYQYYMDYKIKPAGKCSYKNKDDLFMTIGAMCAVWCKCFKASIAPLFEFNTLMEDRNYHYRLINRITSYSNFGQVTHTWNKCNTKSVTSDHSIKYGNDLQAKLEWDHCAYRHIAGMLDILNELDNPKYIDFIKERIAKCKSDTAKGVYWQY